MSSNSISMVRYSSQRSKRTASEKYYKEQAPMGTIQEQEAKLNSFGAQQQQKQPNQNENPMNEVD